MTWVFPFTWGLETFSFVFKWAVLKSKSYFFFLNTDMERGFGRPKRNWRVSKNSLINNPLGKLSLEFAEYCKHTVINITSNAFQTSENYHTFTIIDDYICMWIQWRNIKCWALTLHALRFVFNPFILFFFPKLSCWQLKGLGLGLAELIKCECTDTKSVFMSTVDNFSANYLTFLGLPNWLYLHESGILK